MPFYRLENCLVQEKLIRAGRENGAGYCVGSSTRAESRKDPPKLRAHPSLSLLSQRKSMPFHCLLSPPSFPLLSRFPQIHHGYAALKCCNRGPSFWNILPVGASWLVHPDSSFSLWTNATLLQLVYSNIWPLGLNTDHPNNESVSWLNTQASLQQRFGPPCSMLYPRT